MPDGASDASESDNEVYVGGWLTNLHEPNKSQVSWFHCQVTESRHPWAFKDHKPKRRVAALEIVGTSPASVASDNQGNIYGLLNEHSKKMPTAGLLMEIMFQLTANSCRLMASLVKRDLNQWADDLTHPSFQGLDPALQLDVKRLLGTFKIFPWILTHLDPQGELPTAEMVVEPVAPAPLVKKRRKR